jgi:DNA invertase Pin-like site-specific DNA recombinase
MTSPVIKAFSYLRVSGKAQVTGDGFPRQRQAIKTYSAQHGYRIAHEYRDEGVSGAIETMDRPAWQAMKQALLSDGVRVVIIERLDRLARDLMVQETAIGDLQKAGFTLISVMEPDLMATEPTRVMIRQILGAVAQHDKANIVIKLRAARDRMKAKTGRCEGRKPFGHYDGESEVLAQMQDLRKQGMGYDAIARHLNGHGVATRGRGQWHGWAVNQILNRP